MKQPKACKQNQTQVKLLTIKNNQWHANRIKHKQTITIIKSDKNETIKEMQTKPNTRQAIIIKSNQKMGQSKTCRQTQTKTK